MSGLPETVFFTDRDLGTRFPDILAAAGLNVEFSIPCAAPTAVIAKVYRSSPPELNNDAQAAGEVTLWYPR